MEKLSIKYKIPDLLTYAQLGAIKQIRRDTKERQHTTYSDYQNVDKLAVAGVAVGLGVFADEEMEKAQEEKELLKVAMQDMLELDPMGNETYRILGEVLFGGDRIKSELSLVRKPSN